MSFQYTRSQLLSDIDAGIHGKIGMISSQGDFVNKVVREVNNDVAVRSTRRKSTLAPDLFPGIFQYACPADMRSNRIIDIPAQAKDQRQDGSWNLVPIEQFNTRPKHGDIAFDDYNGVRVLMIQSQQPATQSVLSELDTTTSGGGTWAAFGDAENVAADSDDYIKGSGSVSFDISSAGGTTAGLENTDLNTWDITDYLGGHSSAFVWVKINSATDLTNFILRLGSDNSNYYSKTITTRHDGTAFVAGWNLLRFDLTSLTETGTVDIDAMEYAAIYMTKAAGKVSETDYKFDHLVVMKGAIHEVLYYSKYGWQSSAGTYLENSTAADDLLVADTEEYDIFVKKGVHLGRQYIKSDRGDIRDAQDDYKEAVSAYAPQNPDESNVMISSYQEQ